MSRIYNFSAGPAVLPEDVLRKASDELIEFGSSGMSVMEMSHRSSAFQGIIDEAEDDLRELMGIPEDYHVLFLQGGASLQFAMIPMNLMTINKTCDFIHTGAWTEKAIKEARLIGDAKMIASSEDTLFSYIPELSGIDFNADADYLHICHNNTIYGTKFCDIPSNSRIPLIADMSSSMLSEEMNIENYDLIFAGAQKNIGPAGVTIVILNKKLVNRIPKGLPTMLDYRTHIDSASLFNTPPTYSIYMAGLVFKWLRNMGGIKKMEEVNLEKSGLLYNFIDNSDLFKGHAETAYRSLMNVTFSTGSKDLDKKFVEEAAKEGLSTLNGHKSVGGMRASIYNAMPLEGVKKLVKFMETFELAN